MGRRKKNFEGFGPVDSKPVAADVVKVEDTFDVPDEAEVPKEVTFSGSGTLLLNGDIISFVHGKYTTGNIKQIEALTSRGFKRA